MEKIWLKSYQNGVAAEIDTTRYSSIVDMINQSVQQYSHQIAFSNTVAPFSNHLTYQEVGKLSDQFCKTHLNYPKASALLL